MESVQVQNKLSSQRVGKVKRLTKALVDVLREESDILVKTTAAMNLAAAAVSAYCITMQIPPEGVDTILQKYQQLVKMFLDRDPDYQAFLREREAAKNG